MYRFLEILPGTLTWLTLIMMVVASIHWPVAVAIFIILFDIYWFFRVATLSLYLMFTFRQMKQNMAVNWLEKVKEIASLSKKIEAFPCRRMGEDHFLGRKCAQLRNMLETGMYHPKELNELKQFVVERQELERMRNVK